MSALSDSIAAAQEAFIEDLCARGFTLLDDCCTIVGDIDIDGRPVEHCIELCDDFPIGMPRVSTPGGEGGMSWHRDADGAFCLWSDDEASDLPWGDAEAVIGRIQEWHAKDLAGWPDDPADLDLERYWPAVPGLIIHPDLAPLTGRTCRAKKERRGVLRIMAGQAHHNSQKQRWLGAAVVDAGELTEPIRSFDELADLLGAQETEKLRAGIEAGSVIVVMVRYRRQGHEAAIGLIAQNRNPNRLSATETAHTGESTRRLRAGLDLAALTDSSIAIVGLGAVGSLLAEMLIRSGVGALTFIDGRTVRPGNCIRHVATPDDVGRYKVEAVRDRIVAAGLLSEREARARIALRTAMLASAAAAEGLFDEHDLVIDATGDGPVTALVCTASRILAKPAVTVCLQRGGAVARVDRFPLRDGETHDEPLPPKDPDVVLREGGCGDPVSPTPPWACASAAARAAGMATDLLAGRCMYPPTVIDVLIGQRDGLPVATGA